MGLGGKLFFHMLFDETDFLAGRRAAMREICAHTQFLANIKPDIEDRDVDTIKPHWVNPNAFLPTPEPE